MRYNLMIKTYLANFLPVSLILSGCGGATTAGGTAKNFNSWVSITNPSVVTVSGVAYEGSYTHDTSSGNLNSIGAASAASSPTVSLTYNSSGTITAATISTATQTQNYDSFYDANSIGSLFFAEKKSSAKDWALATDPTNTTFDWKYNAMAAWTDPDVSGSGKYGSISAGSQTTGSNIPTSSSATFSGAGGGIYTEATDNLYGTKTDITANANFATGQVTLSSVSTGKRKFNTSSSQFETYANDNSLNFTGNLTHSSGTNSLSGTLTTTSGMSGPSQSIITGQMRKKLVEFST